MDHINEIKKLEKKIMMTRLTGILFAIVLFVGYMAGVSIKIMAPVVIIAALGVIGIVGIPAQKRLIELRKELISKGGETDE